MSCKKTDASMHRLTFIGNESPYLDLLSSLGHLEHVVCEEIGKNTARIFGSSLEFARKSDIKIIHPDDYLTAPVDTDIIFVSGFGRLIPKRVISVPSIGIINIHQSYLPFYRGRHPMNWAIINGERQTGVTLHHIDSGFDTGNIILQKKVPIFQSDTIMDLHWRTVGEAKKLLIRLFESIGTELFAGFAQSSLSGSYFPPRTPRDGLIDWSEDSERICNLVRALVYPYPGAYSYVNGRKIVIDAARPMQRVDRGAVALPGNIVTHGARNFIKAGDGFVEILKVRNKLPMNVLFHTK